MTNFSKPAITVYILHSKLLEPVYCRFLVPGNTQRFDTSFEMKMMVKIYAIEIILKFDEPFQSYQPIQPEWLVRPGQLAGNSERARGILK